MSGQDSSKFLPLEPGNSGRVKFNNVSKEFRASYLSGTWIAPTGDIVAYLEEESKKITGPAYISIVSKVLVKRGTTYLPSVQICTRNCTNLVIDPQDIDRIAGLKPINFDPLKEI